MSAEETTLGPTEEVAFTSAVDAIESVFRAEQGRKPHAREVLRISSAISGASLAAAFTDVDRDVEKETISLEAKILRDKFGLAASKIARDRRQGAA